MKEVAVRADILVCNADHVLKDHVVVFDKTSIVDIMPTDQFKKEHPNIDIIYKENSILTPGFINAHTHLELSFIHRIKTFDHFFDWVSKVNQKRASVKTIDQLKENQEIIRRTVYQGTVAFGDITNSGTLITFLEDKNIRSHSFIEILGFQSDRAEEIWENIVKKYQTYINSSHVSLTPHAVYSLSAELIEKLAKSKKLQSIHIDELRAERKFLKNAKGEIREFINKLELWDENWTIPQETPIDYIESFKFKNLIYVHLLHLTEAEFKHLDKNQRIVLCPRSNKYLHDELPKIDRFLKYGLKPALGTDSMASNDDLSILEEMKFVNSNFSIPANEIFRMGTKNGADVLNFKKMGEIKKSNSPVCNYFQFDVLSADPFEQLLTDNYKSLEILNL
jgi:cytosine/adenosine deaminase-related metal-dependent hydrolase